MKTNCTHSPHKTKCMYCKDEFECNEYYLPDLCDECSNLDGVLNCEVTSQKLKKDIKELILVLNNKAITPVEFKKYRDILIGRNEAHYKSIAKKLKLKIMKGGNYGF